MPEFPEYEVKEQAEAAWVPVVIAVGAVAGAIMLALEVPINIIVAVEAMFAAAARPVIGLLLPSPKRRKSRRAIADGG